VVTTSVPVGANPVALAEMPNTGSTNQKLYVASKNSNNVTVVNVLDDSLGTPVLIGAPQVWAVARSDSARIYVLDANGVVSVIDIGDGSRAYVAAFQLTNCTDSSGTFPCINTQVDVINVGASSVSKVIPIASSVPVDASNADGCGGTSSPAAFWVPGSARFR